MSNIDTQRPRVDLANFTIDFWVNPTTVNSSLDQFLFNTLR